MNGFIIGLKNILNDYKSKNIKKIFAVTFKLIFIIIFVCVCKTPILLFRELSVDYFCKISSFYSNLLYYLFELLYLFVAVYLFREIIKIVFKYVK